MNFSPPKSMSARVSAHSVLPTPDGPVKRNTPSGASGFPMPVFEARMVLASSPSASSWPITRCCRRLSSSKSAAASSLTIDPRGMPVQSDITCAHTEAETTGKTMGFSPCTASSFSVSASSFAARSFSVWEALPDSLALTSSVCNEMMEAASSFSFVHCSVSRAIFSLDPAMSAVHFSTISGESPMPAARSLLRVLSSSSALSSVRSALSSWAGFVLWLILTRAHAVSSTSTALSGSCRPDI